MSTKTTREASSARLLCFHFGGKWKDSAVEGPSNENKKTRRQENPDQKKSLVGFSSSIRFCCVGFLTEKRLGFGSTVFSSFQSRRLHPSIYLLQFHGRKEEGRYNKNHQDSEMNNCIRLAKKRRRVKLSFGIVTRLCKPKLHILITALPQEKKKTPRNRTVSFFAGRQQARIKSQEKKIKHARRGEQKRRNGFSPLTRECVMSAR